MLNALQAICKAEVALFTAVVYLDPTILDNSFSNLGINDLGSATQSLKPLEYFQHHLPLYHVYRRVCIAYVTVVGFGSQRVNHSAATAF